MLRSMTGFAATSHILTLPDGSHSEFTLLIKSLNSRYFEALCRFPYPVSLLESEVTKKLKERLVRGKVTCNLYINKPNIFKSSIEPSITIVRQYIKATDNIKKECSIEGNLNLTTLLTLPNIFTTEEQTLDTVSKKHLLKIIEYLIDQLITAQEEEGIAIKKDLLARITLIKKDIETITKLSKELIEDQKQKVHSTLLELEDDESKFAELKKSALYAILDKIDIHEEVIRFDNHLNAILMQLNSDNIEKGKRLDFTLQELNREINTIASKASNATIGSLAINIKVELEKAREQAQNII